MLDDKLIVLNFAYGFGPFLRAVETALTVNDFLEKAGRGRHRILVPHIYGEAQLRLIQEEFPLYLERFPGEILLDPTLGGFLKRVFYDEHGYADSLRRFIDHGREVSEEIASHLRSVFMVRTVGGESVRLNGKDIDLEIARSPRLDFLQDCPSYALGFGHVSGILRLALEERVGNCDSTILEQAALLYQTLEQKYLLQFIAEPSTFFYHRPEPLYGSEVFTPPHLRRLPQPDNTEELSAGIYVTVTGIRGLERLFADLKNLNLKVYTNRPEALGFGEKRTPSVLGHHSIKFHLARSGWGSAWLSQITGTPFVALPYDQSDDPEIYFNNQILEKLGLGLIYNERPVTDIINWTGMFKLRARELNQSIIAKYGTLDGIEYSAKKIADHFLML